MIGARNKEPDSNERGRPYDDYKVATLCPLLSLIGQELTLNERLDFTECEAAAIKSSTTWADSFTHMYLTNPPCTEVEVAFVSLAQVSPPPDIHIPTQNTPSVVLASFKWKLV
jgi:hypothetical protein